MIVEWYRELFLFLWKYLGFFGGIVGISVIVSLACFPIYNVIGRMVGMENAVQSVLNPAIAKIKETFSDAAERQSAIERLYARFGYHPIMGVRKVLPLFVSIPFLMLTYYMLAGTSELEGVKWLCFNDLSKPDGMLFGLNLLPFVMTGVNLLTVYATPCFNKKDEVQAWVIAIFFLVLLYSANTALMIYWTLNQIFNFGRTLCEKHLAGAKLLLARIAAIPGDLAKLLRSSLLLLNSPFFLAYGTLVLTLLSCYQYVLTQYLSGGWRNWYFSFYFLNLVFALAVILTHRLFRLSKKHEINPLSNYNSKLELLSTTTSNINLFFAILVALANLAIDASIPFTAIGMKFATQTIPLTTVFLVLFVLWTIPFLLLVRPRPLLAALREAWAENWYLFMLPIVLGIHYAFASANFKLPVTSVAMLSFYLLLPCMIAAVAAVVLFYCFLPSARVARIVIGVVVAMWLLPMVSVENGKLLGYGYNMPIRILMLTIVPLVLLRLKKLTTGIVFVSLLSVAMIVNAYTHRTDEVASRSAQANVAEPQSAVFSALTCTHTNNVYLFIYDSYPHQGILDALGLDNHNLSQYLTDHGFTNYCAYSEGSDTIGSMAAMFDIGGVYASPRARMAGNNHFCDFLKRAGYHTNFMLGGYSMPGHGEPLPGDFYFPSPMEVTRPEMVLFPWIVRGCLTQLPNTFNQFTHDEWVAIKRERMSQMGTGKSFLYAHCEFPAHAVVSLAHRKSNQGEIADFAKRLAIADAELREDVRLVTERDPNAIVVVASDHGGILIPPEKVGEYDARHLLDRCGILLAIRWPKDYKPTLQLDCLQNVWLEVMIYMSGDASLARFEREGITQPITHPVKASAGAIRRGVIQSGRDAGKPLFSGAKECFKRRGGEGCVIKKIGVENRVESRGRK